MSRDVELVSAVDAEGVELVTFEGRRFERLGNILVLATDDQAAMRSIRQLFKAEHGREALPSWVRYIVQVPADTRLLHVKE